MNWEKYFEMIIDWKKLPAYRAEPRIDSLIGYYLKDIISDYFNVQILEIIPELPLRLGTIHPEYNYKNFADRSYKVDFFAIGDKDYNYLVEFKTDQTSLREPQDKYLNNAQKLGTEAIIAGILKIANVSSYKVKYGHLIEKLINCGLLTDTFKYTGKNSKCEKVYIIPFNKNKEKNVIDYSWIVKWFQKFEKLNDFELAFVSTLNQWYLEYSNNNINGA